MTREELEQQIRNLTAELASTVSPIGDWKIAKNQEYLQAGLEAPYDINELHSQRQAIRDEINRIRREIEDLPEDAELIAPAAHDDGN